MRMLQWKRRPRQTARNDGDGLTELLVGEERVASQLDAARSEADQILRDAQDYARLAELACASTMETRVAALLTEHERELDVALRAIESRAAEDIARFDSVGKPEPTSSPRWSFGASARWTRLIRRDFAA